VFPKELLSVDAFLALLVLALMAGPACTSLERPKRTVQLQVLVVGYSSWARAEESANPDVREYNCAPGDTFGAGRLPECCDREGPFILVSITGDSTAVIRYPRCLDMTRGFASWYVLPVQPSPRRRGPDTVEVSTDWRHFDTHVTDGGCAYSVRIKPSAF
jgi:hypothetical protein